MAKKPRIPHKFQPWIDARKKFRLSDAQIQMARELGLSPKRFAAYADRKDEPWKLTLPKFIEALYEKQFRKPRPDHVQSMEEIAAAHIAKRAARKAEKAERIAAGEENVHDASSDIDALNDESSMDESSLDESSLDARVTSEELTEDGES